MCICTMVKALSFVFAFLVILLRCLDKSSLLSLVILSTFFVLFLVIMSQPDYSPSGPLLWPKPLRYYLTELYKIQSFLEGNAAYYYFS